MSTGCRPYKYRGVASGRSARHADNHVVQLLPYSHSYQCDLLGGRYVAGNFTPPTPLFIVESTHIRKTVEINFSKGVSCDAIFFCHILQSALCVCVLREIEEENNNAAVVDSFVLNNAKELVFNVTYGIVMGLVVNA